MCFEGLQQKSKRQRYPCQGEMNHFGNQIWYRKIYLVLPNNFLLMVSRYFLQTAEISFKENTCVINNPAAVEVYQTCFMTHDLAAPLLLRIRLTPNWTTPENPWQGGEGGTAYEVHLPRHGSLPFTALL